MSRLCSPPTLFIAAGGRHRSSHTAKLVNVAAAPSSSPVLKPFVFTAAAQALRRRSFSFRWWLPLLLRRRRCSSLRPRHSSSHRRRRNSLQ
nr:hypothetical protein Itr_chr13CG18600 [Ipomoea trifida]